LLIQDTGKTSLHRACEKQDFDMVKKLVEKGANVLAKDAWGLTVLHYQHTLKSTDIVTYLVHKGLSVDAKHEVSKKE